MAGIRDVARVAGVSVSSVSRYFNNPDMLTAQKRAAIGAAVEALQYTPSSLGRGLRLLKSGKILILLPTLSNPIYQKLLAAIDEACLGYGMRTLVCSTNNDAYRERDLLQMLGNRYVDGVILFASALPPQEITDLARKYPVVQCCEFTEGAVVSTVSIDNYRAAFEAVRHLVDQGHRRIALISGQSAYGSTPQRELGYLDALGDLTYRRIVRGAYGYGSGAAAARELLGHKERPTAIFAVSDAMAIGAAHEALSGGLKVGEDLAIVGFDDTKQASMYWPPLSSVYQPREELGKAALDCLMRQVNKKDSIEHIVLPYKLVIRQSSMKNIERRRD